MHPISFLSYSAMCPRCAEVHEVRVQTEIADWGQEYGARELQVGDHVPLTDLANDGFFASAEPSPGEPLRLLDEGIRCGDERLFTEIALDAGNKIVELSLVRCDRNTLDRVNYLSPLRSILWDWAGSLPDPSDWNEDDLYTVDRVRALRISLLVVEVLRARNLHEADLLIELFGATRNGPPTPIEGTPHWRIECTVAYDGHVRALTFALDDPRELDASEEVVLLPGGPSRILPADVFRRKADALVGAVPVYAADLSADPGRLAQARRQLAQAIVYLEQLLTYIPEDDDYVPLAAFWGDRPREDREEHEDRYGRRHLDATLVRWRAELERLGRRERYAVRSAEEAYVFMSIHPCPRCGTATPSNLPSRLEADGDDLISVYEGPCPTCDLPRRFEMRLPDEPVLQDGDAIVLGPGVSACLDPGQLLIAADQLARRNNGYALQLAVAAIDEILKIFGDASFVREDTITSRAGWAVYEKEPGRFRRDRLEAMRDRYRELLG